MLPDLQIDNHGFSRYSNSWRCRNTKQQLEFFYALSDDDCHLSIDLPFDDAVRVAAFVKQLKEEKK